MKASPNQRSPQQSSVGESGSTKQKERCDQMVHMGLPLSGFTIVAYVFAHSDLSRVTAVVTEDGQCGFHL